VHSIPLVPFLWLGFVSRRTRFGRGAICRSCGVGSAFVCELVCAGNLSRLGRVEACLRGSPRAPVYKKVNLSKALLPLLGLFSVRLVLQALGLVILSEDHVWILQCRLNCFAIQTFQHCQCAANQFFVSLCALLYLVCVLFEVFVGATLGVAEARGIKKKNLPRVAFGLEAALLLSV